MDVAKDGKDKMRYWRLAWAWHGSTIPALHELMIAFLASVLSFLYFATNWELET
jgi:hypothetical protein